MFKDIRIETPRLILRPFKPVDVDAFHHILSQPEVMHYLPESVMTRQQVKGIIDWYRTCYQKNTPEKIIKWTLAVCLDDAIDPNRAESPEDADQVIGWAGIGPLEFDESETEIFYGLSSEYWGKGYATEAARAVLEYAFEIIGLKRVVGVANPENAASVKILEKIGMIFEKKLVGLPAEFKNDEGSHYYAKIAL